MSQARGGSASRRTFLKAVGGVVGAAALPLGRSSAAWGETSSDYDVVVIGGGFAGITAARELRHAGLRTLVLEARNRLGGRTFTARVGEEIFELGGTWVHSTQPHVFAEVSRYGFELVETQAEIPERLLWWDGERAREAGVREFLPLLKEAVCASSEATSDAPMSVLKGFALLSGQMSDFHAGAAAAFPRPFEPFFTDAWKQADALSVRDRLDQMGLSAGRRGLLEGVLGASAHGAFDQASFAEMLRWWALSGHDLQRYSDSVARFRLRDGTASLIDAMVEDGRPEVRLATPVAEVAQDGTQVEITTQGGERFTARAAIAALPMNVLANIRFTPVLHPDKVAASRERHAGAGVKVYVRVRGELPPLAIFAAESEPFSSVFTMGGGGHGAELVAFGTDPKRIDVHSRAAVQGALRRFLPEVEVANTLAYDWHLDPYSLGTWCILRKGQMTRFLAALRESHGRVHFAGSDLALGWRGFIDGAIESGNRVAQEVIARLEGRTAGAPAPAPASELAQGEATVQQCAVCHPTDASGSHGAGPNLRGVIGRPAASAPDFAYSEALRGRGTTWTDQELDAFLTEPAGYAPGTSMPFAGLKDPTDRAAVIRFLRDLK
ncbi:MAG: FAD-dependent oxidoreductase [Myxococcota bacterium]